MPVSKCWRLTDTVFFWQPSLPESITNTLPSLCKIFKKPQRQQGTSTPSRDFRKHYMCQTWDDNYVQISPLHDIMEEEEEEEDEF